MGFERVSVLTFDLYSLYLSGLEGLGYKLIYRDIQGLWEDHLGDYG